MRIYARDSEGSHMHRRNARMRFLCVAMRFLAVAVSVLVLGRVEVRAGGQSPPPPTIARKNPSPYAVNASGDSSSMLNSAQIARINESGFKWVRTFFSWRCLQPKDYKKACCGSDPCPASYAPCINSDGYDVCYANFKLDDVKNLYGDPSNPSGTSILGVLTGTPDWANASGPAQPNCAIDRKRAYQPDNAFYFMDFTYALSRWARLKAGQQPMPGEDPNACDVGDARCEGFSHFVGAWELWNEPDDCFYWRGTKAQYRERILQAGYTGITAANTGQLIVAPAVTSDALLSNLNDYLMSGGSLVVPLDVVSFHMYRDKNTDLSRMQQVSTWLDSGKCTANGAECVDRFWVTEFGFHSAPGHQPPPCVNSGVEDPGCALNTILDACVNGFRCEKAFVFSMDDWWSYPDDPPCDQALINRNNVPRGRYCTVKAHLTSGGAPCPAQSPSCN